MFKKPVKPEEVYEEFSSGIESIFGSNLLSIYLYGSGARGEYIQGKSDINFLVVIKSEGLKFLSGV
ncbi:MAG: nucleotidyltransferase domain-containing protein, partial [Candidatus Marinimicrobia bacterium]|nr:nucleotidyltransferase domain-containing protein [Candidatus Neomarinimicrobiota bacterium]